MPPLELIPSDRSRLPNRPVRAIGIDLGTTISAVAEISWDPNSNETPYPECIQVVQPTDEGDYIDRKVPSVVSVRGDEIRVGRGARSLIGTDGSVPGRNIFYDCKNDIGVRRTYMGPEGLRSAKEIGGKVLAFLKRAADKESDDPVDQFTITVPASFQMAQRSDTVQAAELGGIEVEGGDLMDEPVAALVDYVFSHGDTIPTDGNLLVFDFGGGTCDIAIFRVSAVKPGSLPDIAELSVSRYHRLGGGDIDTSIVHQVLIPQLIEQNDIDDNDLTFVQRKHRIEPKLLSIAESLKIGLCSQIQSLQDFGKYAAADKAAVKQEHPSSILIKLPEVGELKLTAPTLSVAELDSVLERFLDTDLLYTTETEYELACSIFAPIKDAIDDAGLDPPDVSYCLLVGGSSLIPQVRDAIERFLPAAKLLRQEDEEGTQLAVARGAAYNALSLALRGIPIIRHIASKDVSVQTDAGPIPLIPRGEPLPYPAEGFEERTLATPKTTLAESEDLRVEILAGEATIYAETWRVPPRVPKGTPLTLRYRYDENKVLRLELGIEVDSLLDGAVEALVIHELLQSTIENPLSNVQNPSKVRNEIIDIEEELRIAGRQMSEAQLARKLNTLSDKYSELGQIDKAVSVLDNALRVQPGGKSWILNKLGILHGRKGDRQRQEKMYRASADEDPSSASPLFNLALAYYGHGQIEDAAAAIEAVLQRRDDGPTRTLASMIYERLRSHDDSEAALDRAFTLFQPLSLMSDWELGWYHTAAQLRRDDDALRQHSEEKDRRGRAGMESRVSGELPTHPGDDV